MTGTPSGMRPADQAVARKAKLGREALFPFDHETHFGRAALGADQLADPLPYPGLESLLIAPPLFTPYRYERMVELGREPLHLDVDTRTVLGGFVAAMPIAVAAMGSTDLANRHGPALAEAAGRAGVVLTIGENVGTMRGYATRLKEDEPCLKERMLAYLDHCPEGMGGLLVQQSVEDADAELWNRIYADPDLAPYFDAGMIGFEIKCGQGAKPGLGGETRVDREEALRLKDRFSFPDDPATTQLPFYDRHAAPGTFTPEILRNMIRLIQNNHPKARVWIKVGGFRDMQEILAIAQGCGVDNVTIDGHAGGTGMAPVLALRHLGLPTLTGLAHAAAARRRALVQEAMEGGSPRTSTTTFLIAGGLSDGADAVKACAVGASGIALGRALLSAAEAGGIEGVRRFLAVTREEVQLAMSAVGKYHVEDLAPEDVAATRVDVADLLGVPYVFSPPAVEAGSPAASASAGAADWRAAAEPAR